MDLGLTISDLRSSRRGRRRSGFSFTEVMFAVIILGIGFIMVAAIFPVAIQQAKSTTEETTAAVIARGAAGYLGQAFDDGPHKTADQNTSSNCPPPNLDNVVGFRQQTVLSNPPMVQQPSDVVRTPSPSTLVYPPTLWAATRGNLILPEDRRFGYVFLYRRQGLTTDPKTWGQTAQVYIFPVQSRAAAEFSSDADAKIPLGSLGGPNEHLPANLQARLVQVAIRNDVASQGGVDLLAFDLAVSAIRSINVRAAAEGSYVIIADDKISSPAAAPNGDDRGRMNGRVFKLGAARPDLDTGPVGLAIFPGMNQRVVYELQPGSDFTPDAGANGVLGKPGAWDSDDICALGVNGAEPGSGVQFNSPTGKSADAYLIGRGYSQDMLANIASGVAINSANQVSYDGTVMPVGVYTTFVQVKQ
ncbi:MAG TPA: hypothetical protein VH518_05995 [Tepidisphaeraceae bacterium]|jgi:type II secretory pathway pseudopilin PulG